MADMEVCDDPVETKKCFKCNHQLLGNLNVAYNAANSMIILWNKYQLFLYENFNFDDATRIFLPEFIVHQIIISNNYLICLDCSGNVHVTSLKFKNPAQKRLKTTFQPREQFVVASVQRDEHILNLKLECETYFLSLNRINSEFQKEKEIALKYENDSWPLRKTTQEKCLITRYKIPENNEHVKQMFNYQGVYKDCDIVVLTFDKLDIFACLFSPNMNDEVIELIKLYSCPSEICNMQIVDTEELNLIIILTSGTVIKLPFLKPPPALVPIHLNTAVFKFIVSKETIIYTDGASMWKTENSFSKIKFSQFFIRHAKDFLSFGDQIICTTYTNLIYLISVDDELNYLKPESELYCPVDKLLNNSEYLFKLLEEVDKNNELIEKVNEEGNYITALALSNRPDLMDTILQNNIVVYEHYEDAVKENPDITLTEDLKEYFKTDSLLFLIKIMTLQMEQLVNEVLTQLFNNSKIHVSLFSENKLLKTNSIKIIESLKKINVLIPVNNKEIYNATAVRASIKIVSHVPGVFDSKVPVWTTLYHKEINLNSEHFIKTNLIASKNISLRNPQETIEDLIFRAAIIEHGNLFKFTDISNVAAKPTEFSMFVKLPTNYTEIFHNHERFTDRFNTRKAEYLSKQLTSEEFLKSKSNLIFEVGNVKVDVEIMRDEVSPPLLRVASEDVTTALNMRNFFAELIYDDFKLRSSEAVDYAFYSVVEDLQKAIKDGITSSETKDLQSLTEQFQKTIIGGLPI